MVELGGGPSARRTCRRVADCTRGRAPSDQRSRRDPKGSQRGKDFRCGTGGRRQPPPARHRRVARQGQDDRGLPRPRLRRGVARSATSATCRAARRRSPPTYKGDLWSTAGRRRRQRLRAGLRRRRRQASSRSPSSRPAEGRRRALPRDRRGPRGRGHRLAPARGAQADGAGAPDGLPRDHPEPRSRGAVANPREHRPALVDAQETRRILDRLYGYEVSPGAVEEGHAAAVGRPGAVASRPGWSSSANASGWRSGAAEYWDLEGTFDAGAPKPATRVVRRHAGRASTARGSPPAATSTQDGQLVRATSCTSTRPVRRGWPPRLARTRRSRCARRGAALPPLAVPRRS